MNGIGVASLFAKIEGYRAANRRRIKLATPKQSRPTPLIYDLDMDRFARIVLGFHGCEAAFATNVVTRGAEAIREWAESANNYDWLGRGIYFWEHAPERALRWAKENNRVTEAAVVGAVIQLGRCFDLTDIRYTEMLAEAYQREREEKDAAGLAMPENA
jgi:hypothetical protein